jgi:hypothetical protein
MYAGGRVPVGLTPSQAYEPLTILPDTAYQAARVLHETVRTSFADNANVTVDDLGDDSFCFRLTFGTSHGTVGGMSVSVPPDARGQFEIALVNTEGSLVYVDNLPPYHDVRRCPTAEKVCDEIARVLDVITTLVAAPEKADNLQLPCGCYAERRRCSCLDHADLGACECKTEWFQFGWQCWHKDADFRRHTKRGYYLPG